MSFKEKDVRLSVREKEQIVQRMKDGDDTAFGRLVASCHGYACNSIKRYFDCQEEDARDILQEAVVKAFQECRSFEGRSEFSTWLVRIAIRVGLDRRKNDQRLPIVPLTEAADAEHLGPEDEILEKPKPVVKMVLAEIYSNLNNEENWTLFILSRLGRSGSPGPVMSLEEMLDFIDSPEQNSLPDSYKGMTAQEIATEKRMNVYTVRERFRRTIKPAVEKAKKKFGIRTQ